MRLFISEAIMLYVLDQKTNSHVASNVLSSAVSASGFRRLDTGSVVEDILESDKGSDFSG